jgi:hypothetical protein
MPRPLKTALACLLFISAIHSGHAQPLTLSFTTPYTNQPVDSVFTVKVLCQNQTAYGITSVVATIGGRSTVLTSSGTSSYSGGVSLVGLTRGSTDTLTVEAKDAGGDSAIISEPVINDAPPVVTLTSPVQGAVGRPTINIKANCASTAGHCQLSVLIMNGTAYQSVGTFTDSVTTAVDVSAYEGSWNLSVLVTGTDQYNVQTQQGVDFYVETSPYLTPLYSANNPIIDFSGNNVLVFNTLKTIPPDSPRIVNYTTGAANAIPYTLGLAYTNPPVFLRSTGLVFQGAGPVVGWQYVYDWTNGTLDTLAAGGNLQVSGSYASYGGNGGYPLYIENLSTRTTQLIDQTVDFYGLDSSAVAYADNANGARGYDSLFLYQNGASKLISEKGVDTLFTQPLTDGKNVVYAESASGTTIYRYDGKSGTNTLLANLGTGAVDANLADFPYYRVSNGYTAYIQLDANSRYQAWVRDTAGNNTQVSSFNYSAYLETMAPNGQLAFKVNTVGSTGSGLRYIYDKTAGLTPVSSNYTGTPYYQNGSWYLVIGNTLFGVNLTISPDKADSFAVNVKEDSLYTFSVNDFASHYQTNGFLTSVVIWKLPANGTLKLGGVGVWTGEVIPRSSLATLVYTPALNFVGTDTARWSGSNGFTSSPDTALLVFNVDSLIQTLPPAPQISGLPPGYCSNLGVPQHFNVANMRAAGIGTTVAATINGQPVTVAGNGAISIQPWTMQVGTYSVVVIFTNSVGADTATANFQIVQASTPIVTLSATPSVLTASTQQVVLTATDVSGGGTSPLYTFSTDYSFNSYILQAASDSNAMTIAVSSLTADTTVIYVRMQTSDSCATRAVGVDSVVLMKPQDSTTTPPPADTIGASGSITAGPNPFTAELTVSGLDPTKSYVINLIGTLGQIMFTEVAPGQNQVVFLTGTLQRGIYFLRVYDAQSGRVVMSKELLKVNW